MKSPRLLLPTLILTVLFAATTYAQTSGKISGRVLDTDTSEPLIGANVIIEGTNLGAATNVDGTFFILRVPPGVHRVSAEYIGYSKVIQDKVLVYTDLTTEVNFDLKQSMLSGEEVVVTAETPLVRKDLTSAEARVPAAEIEALPVQELGDILDLQAGITRDAGGDIHIRGGRSSEVSYLVNGISITDDYSRGQSFEIENESVQELQVVSGTFNAEYGNAMSGIINVVTKTGGQELHGNFETWFGDYVSSHDEIFWNIDDRKINALENYQGTLGGPILRDRITFFASGRHTENEGWLFGPNRYSPQGRTGFVDGQIVPVAGDSSAVSMNNSERVSGQFSLNWQAAGPIGLKLDFLGSSEKRRNYNHNYRLNPLGYGNSRSQGYAGLLKLTHVLGEGLFYEVTAARKYNQNRFRLYDEPLDARYVHPDSANAPVSTFLRAGTDLRHFKRSTESYIAKFDITSQINSHHLFKSGIEVQSDKVSFNDIDIRPKVNESGQQVEPFEPDIPDISNAFHDEYTRKPLKLAAYIQDKIEYQSLVINLGLRLDLFDPRGKVPVDGDDPNIFNPFKLQHIYRDTDGDGEIALEEQRAANEYSVAEREAFWYKDTSIKWQLSPRLGIGYPITESGVIHFSYGIFQQVPEYSLLYNDDQYKMTIEQGIKGPFGNPDLKPQRTIMYEIGLNQQLMESLGIEATVFYRDIRDWISTSPPITTTVAGISYSRNINRDFANVRGVTLALTRRLHNHFGFNVDYTFQIAEGTNSSPDEEFFALQDGSEPTKRLTYLGWDQRHTLNSNVFYGSRTCGIGILGKFDSGQPYTPEVLTSAFTGRNIISGLEENSRRRPDLFAVDMNLYKNIDIPGGQVQVFLDVYNLLDAGNPRTVFGDSGDPDFTLRQLTVVEADPTFFTRPDFYSSPREVHFGVQYRF